MKKTKCTKFLSLAVIVTGLVLVLTGGALYADDKGKSHDEKSHSHTKKIAGPNGGRLITSVKPRLEFFVTKNRKIQITAVDDHNKAIALEGQSVKVSGGSRFRPTRMKFEKKEGALISSNSFPEGKALPVVVQIKSSPDAKAVIEKFYLNQSNCPGCKYEEYACICGHGDHAN